MENFAPPLYGFNYTTMNKTVCPAVYDGYSSCYLPTGVPFYHTERRYLVPGIPDHFLAGIAPVVGYWVFSLFFHALDTSGWQWLDKYRIHESADVKSRNLATRTQVVWTVVFQQVIQTIAASIFVTEDLHGGPGRWRGEMQDLGKVVVRVVRSALGNETGGKLLQAKGMDLVYFLYWWGIPVAQFFLAMCVYFLFTCDPCLYQMCGQVHY
jgi:sphinganine C4-monooxygenase